MRPVFTTNGLPGDGSDIGAFESGGYLRLTSVARTNSATRVQFTTDLGHDYRVERRDALDSGTWLTLPGVVPGTGGIAPFLDSGATDSQGFYRVRLQQE